jgi:hypothetical protein
LLSLRSDSNSAAATAAKVTSLADLILTRFTHRLHDVSYRRF